MQNTTGQSAAQTDRKLLMWLARGCRWLLALVFLAAGLPKILEPHQFAQIISAYGLLPQMLLLPAAIVLPWLEVITAFGLLAGRLWATWLAAGFLLVFIAVLAYGIAIGLAIDCGCFGPGDPEHAAFSGLESALARDVLLLLPVAYSWWFSRRLQNATIQQ